MRWFRASGRGGLGAIVRRTGGPVGWASPRSWQCHKMSQIQQKFRRRTIRKPNSVVPRLGQGPRGVAHSKRVCRLNFQKGPPW